MYWVRTEHLPPRVLASKGAGVGGWWVGGGWWVVGWGLGGEGGGRLVMGVGGDAGV